MRTNLQPKDASVAVPSNELNTETRPIALAMCIILALNGQAAPMSCPVSLQIFEGIVILHSTDASHIYSVYELFVIDS